MSATKPRYMLRLTVVEIDADGEERDVPETYTTMWAIEDAQEADYIAQTQCWGANKQFAARADCSLVTPKEA